MRLPLRSAIAALASAGLAMALALAVPPLVLGKEGYARGHGKGDALSAMDRLAAEAAAGGEAAELAAAYAARYPEMDFELLSADLGVLASSRPGPRRYTIAGLAARLEPAGPGFEDSDSFFRELPAGGEATYLLVRLRSPFYVSLTRPAAEFIRRGLALAAALAILAFGLALAAFSLPYARRVTRLTRSISAYAPGSPPLDARARDETGAIAAAFNGMAARLAAAEEGRRAEERTRKEEEEAWRASVANLSHDLRTPLASVVGYSESLVRSAYSGEEERSRYESIIHAKALYMGGLLDSLLEQSRWGAPRREGEAVPVDLCELAREVAIEYLDEAERRGLAMEAEIPEAPLVALSRPEALSRALRNLLDNALKYGSGGSRLEIRLEGAEGRALLSIRDYGPGIPERERERVFERYYRSDPARGSEAGGLGLGLPIAKAIARAEGGDLVLECPEGGGCRFVLALPLA